MELNDDELLKAFEEIQNMPSFSILEMFPLEMAVKIGDVDIIQQHLDNGAHANDNLLKLSLLSGKIEAVKLLLKNGADPNIPAGNPALESNEYIIDYLVNRGTGLNMSENNFPTLLQFALENHEETFIELLSKDMSFDVNVRNSARFSLLQQAAENNNMKLVKILVDYGAEIDLIPEPHYSPLLCAVSNKNLEMVNFFLDRGASMYFETGRIAPFINAIANDDLEMVKLFLSRGVDVNAKYSHSMTPLHSICDPYDDAEYETEDEDSDNETEEEEKFSSPNRQEILKLLLDHGANVNSQNHYKSTPLHKACAKKRAGDVQMLLTRGINFDTSCYEKCTILHSIKCKKIWKVIELRKPVSTSVDPDKIDLHLSFVDASNMLKSLKRLYYFLGNDVDVDIRNVLNRTAIYYATRRNCCDIIENLLKYLPNVNVSDDKGQTPLMSAFRNYIKEAVLSNLKAIELLTAIIAVRKVINAEEDVQKIDSKLLECIPFIKDHYAKCEMEILEMKDKRIADKCYVRFFDFLSQDINKLAEFTENRKIMRYLYSEKYKEDFPIYESLLERKIQLAELRGKLLQVSQICFQTLAEQNEMPILPSFVVRRILSDLGDIDLFNFLEGATFQR